MATAQVDSRPPTVMHLPGTVNLTPAKFPEPTDATSVDAGAEADKIVESLNKSIADANFSAVGDLFMAEGHWRDHLMLTWNFRTVQGTSKIADFLQECSKSKDGFRLKKFAVDKSSLSRTPKVVPLDGEAKVSGIQVYLSVETVLGTGEGIIRLGQENGKWKIYTLYTSLRELTGHEEGTSSRRPAGVAHGGQPGRKNWIDRRTAAANYNDGSEPAVLIIGK